MIPFSDYQLAADFIRKQCSGFDARTALVLGSGLNALADEVEGAVRIPYGDIPGFPVSTVSSHRGQLVCGRLNGHDVFILAGRFHYYEGYSPAALCFYVRVLRLLGVDRLVLTNAAGAVNCEYSVGDFMLITDHIKLFGVSPVRGEVLPEFGERFFDMTNAYSPRLRECARAAARSIGLPLREGIYFFMPGPEFETPAEIRAVRLLGGDAVGMSTVMETVAAVGCGMEVLGISCITNMAAGIVPGAEVNDAEVVENAALVSGRFRSLICETLSLVNAAK